MPQASSPSSDRGGLKPSPHNAALSLSPSPAHTRADSDEEDDDNGLNR